MPGESQPPELPGHLLSFDVEEYFQVGAFEVLTGYEFCSRVDCLDGEQAVRSGPSHLLS